MELSLPRRRRQTLFKQQQPISVPFMVGELNSPKSAYPGAAACWASGLVFINLEIIHHSVRNGSGLLNLIINHAIVQ